MVKVAKFLGYTLFFIIALFYFTPKASLYYKAELELKKNKVILSDESVIEKPFYLELEHTTVYFNAIQSATVAWIEVEFLGVYNTVKVKDIELSSVVASFIPLHIKEVEVKYTILDPFHVIAYAEGDFGVLNANFSIDNRVLQLHLEASKKMQREHRSTLRQFHKDATGEYNYEKTF